MVSEETITLPFHSHPPLEDAWSDRCIPVVARHADIAATAAAPPGIGVATSRRPIDLVTNDFDVIARRPVLIPHIQPDIRPRLGRREDQVVENFDVVSARDSDADLAGIDQDVSLDDLVRSRQA